MFFMFVGGIVLVAVVVVAVVLFGTGAFSRPRPTEPSRQPTPSPVTGSPGWYTQPDGSQRYWDGQAWTDHTAP